MDDHLPVGYDCWAMPSGSSARGFAKIRLIVSVALPLALGMIAVTAAASRGSTTPDCGTYRKDVVFHIGANSLSVERPRSSAYETGLAGRPCIPPDRGIVFTFKRAGHFSIWMKDMRFPIDVVWIGPNHRVVWVERNLAPSTYPRHFKNRGASALYILEIGAGRAKSLGIARGTQIAF